MHQHQLSDRIGISCLPVLFNTDRLVFYLEDQTTHRQLLTMYNPYEFPVRFKITCTAPRKYTVIEPEGLIKSNFRVDVVFRHNAVSEANCNVTDIFRIQILAQTQSPMITGKRDLPATLVPGRPHVDVQDDSQKFESLPHMGSLSPNVAAGAGRHAVGNPVEQDAADGAPAASLSTPLVLTVIVFVLSALGLMMPLEGDQNTSIPASFHVGHQFKLILSFSLGIATMIILKMT